MTQIDTSPEAIARWADALRAEWKQTLTTGSFASKAGDVLEALAADRDDLRAALAEAERQRDEWKARFQAQEKLVYVPGMWRCARCQFTLVQATFNALDGTVSARDKPGDKCPNCDAPLWRVTERDSGREVSLRCEQAVIEAADLRKEITVMTSQRDAARAALEPFARDTTLPEYDDGVIYWPVTSGDLRAACKAYGDLTP